MDQGWRGRRGLNPCWSTSDGDIFVGRSQYIFMGPPGVDVVGDGAWRRQRDYMVKHLGEGWAGSAVDCRKGCNERERVG